MLGVPVDTYRLYKQDDPLYELWLYELVDKISVTMRENQERQRRGRNS